MHVAQIGEQDGRVGGLDHRQAYIGLPDAIASGLFFGHGEADVVIVVALDHLPVQAVGRAPGGCGHPGGKHGFRPPAALTERR
ncbi:hypothetical protein G6F31_019297 [Rhizopus arrhizus]|nr:hypothetical protein G6F31_019297 [Rhizopus arrhizus]